MCLSDGILRANLDGELSEAESANVSAHLRECAGCRERAGEIASRAEQVREQVAALGPRPDEANVDAGVAYTRFAARMAAPRRELWRARLFSGRFAPAWGGAMAALLLVGLVASAPGRALAERMLGMLRIKAVVAVPMERPSIGEGKGDVLRQVLADSVVTSKESRAVAVANRDDASRMAGYDVRLPELRSDAPQLTVNTEQAFEFTASQQRLRTLLSVVGRTDLDIPAKLDGAKVFVDVPPHVLARYGDCPTGPRWRERQSMRLETCVMIGQVPTPAVVTMPELDLGSIAEFGLQLAGMTPQQAHELSQTIDWTSTLAVPIPRDAASFENVTVSGAKGVLISAAASPDGKRPAHYGLLWARNGMIYSVTGFGDASQAVPLAESLR